MLLSERCIGRIVKPVSKEGVAKLARAGEESVAFLLPFRCEHQAALVEGAGGLCARCLRFEEQVGRRAAALKGDLEPGEGVPATYHGRLTEPIPYWSRLYEGAWFRKKEAEGYRVAEEEMGRVKGVVEAAYGGLGGRPGVAGVNATTPPTKSKKESKSIWPEPDKVIWKKVQAKKQLSILAFPLVESGASPPAGVASEVVSTAAAAPPPVAAQPKPSPPPIQPKSKSKPAPPPAAAAARPARPSKAVSKKPEKVVVVKDIDAPKALVKGRTAPNPVETLQRVRLVRMAGEGPVRYKDVETGDMYDETFTRMGDDSC